MLECKFKGCNVGEPLSDLATFNINDLKANIIARFDYYLQYLGFKDAWKRELYEGDVIELTITPDLMDVTKDGFACSNLGKYIKEQGDITTVGMIFKYDNTFLGVHYDLYFYRNGKLIRDEDGNVEIETSGADYNFPIYLCQKGAVRIGNIVSEPKLLNKFC